MPTLRCRQITVHKEDLEGAEEMKGVGIWLNFSGRLNKNFKDGVVSNYGFLGNSCLGVYWKYHFFLMFCLVKWKPILNLSLWGFRPQMLEIRFFKLQTLSSPNAFLVELSYVEVYLIVVKIYNSGYTKVQVFCFSLCFSKHIQRHILLTHPLRWGVACASQMLPNSSFIPQLWVWDRNNNFVL